MRVVHIKGWNAGNKQKTERRRVGENGIYQNSSPGAQVLNVVSMKTKVCKLFGLGLAPQAPKNPGKDWTMYCMLIRTHHRIGIDQGFIQIFMSPWID